MPIPAVGALGIGIGRSFLGLFGGSHKKKVALEQSTNAAALEQADRELGQIELEVNAGMLKGDAIGTRLDTVKQTFAATVAPVIQETGGKCNAACVWKKQLHDKVEGLRARFKVVAQAVAKQQATVGSKLSRFFSGTAGKVVLFVVPGAFVVGALVLILRGAKRK